MAEILKFGCFELDRQNFELRCEGEPVKLDHIPLELLFFLAENSGRLVTREEAVERVWGKGVFIEAESSIYTAIRKIRQALGDDTQEPQFIQTVSRKGYRFIAEVEKVELTPQTSPAIASRRQTVRLVIGALVTCLLILSVLLFRLRTVRSSSQPPRTMLVVLPMQNLTGDERQEYLADGITEEIITQLGDLDPQHLGVIARTSAMQYKHAAKNTAQISRELGVSYLLEGSIQRSADRIRITAQLIQGSDQTHLWAQSYDRDLSDVLKVESDVATALAGQVRLAIPPQTNERLASVTRVDPAAHDAYLRGLQGWNQRSREGTLQAIGDFTRATQLDPNYAPAFAGLARVYSLAPIFAGLPAEEAAPKALDAASRALALDETLADAHSAIGFVKGHYQHDWATAEREFRRSIALEPNNPYVHFFYSNSFLSPFGHHDEAIAEMRKAMSLDPLATRIQSFAGVTFIWARRYDEARAQFQKVNQLDPNYALNHERLAQLDALLSKYDESIAEETKARLLSGEGPEIVLTKMKDLQRAFTTAGARGYWEEQLRLSLDKQNRPGPYSAPHNLAIVYVHLGDKANALASLELAYTERDEEMTELGVEPEFDPLRSDRHFRDIESRIGLVH